MNAQFAQNMMAGQPGQPGMPMMLNQNQQNNLRYNQLMEMFRKQQSQHMNGWKAELHPQERFGFFRELLTALRLVTPGLNNEQLFERAMEMERAVYTKAVSKESWAQQRAQILTTLQGQRANNVMGLQPGQIRAPQMANTLSNNGTPIPQSFNPQLRGPMQPTPMPGSTQSIQGNGLAAPAMTPQPSGQMTQGNMALGKMLEQYAQQAMQSASPEMIKQASDAWDRLAPQTKLQIQKSGITPGPYWYFYEMAKTRATANANRQMPGQMMNQGQGNPQAGNPMMNAMNFQPNMQGMQGQDMQALLRQNPGMQFANAAQNPGMNNQAMSMQMAGNLMAQNRLGVGGQLPQNGMMGAGMNNMHAQVMQAQQAAQLRQMNVNRPQAMNMMGQVTGQPGMNMMGTMPATPQQGVVKPQQPVQAAQQPNNMAQMANRPTQQQMMQRDRELPQALNPAMRQALLNMPEVDYRKNMDQLRQQAAQRAGQMSNMAQPNHGAMGGQGQMGGQVQAAGVPRPVQQPMGNAMQGGMNQMNQGMGQMRPQAMTLNPQFRVAIERMDQEDFPRSLLTSNTPIQVPDQIRTWAQLKSYLEGQDGMNGKSQEILRVQMNLLVNRSQNQAGINMPARPQGGNLTPQEAAAASRLPVSIQEMALFKTKYNPLAQQLGSDDAIRTFIQQTKFRNQPMAAMPMNNQMQMQLQNGNHMPQQAQLQQQQQPPQQQQQQQQHRQMPMQMNLRGPQASPMPVPTPQAPNMRKRPSSEANEDVPAQMRAIPQAQSMAQTKSEQPGGNSQAPRPGQLPNDDNQKSLNLIMVPIVNQVRLDLVNELERQPSISLKDPNVKAQYQAALNGLQLGVVDTSIKNFFAASKNAEQLKHHMRDRFLITLQFQDPKQGLLKPEVKVDIQNFAAAVNRLKAVAANWTSVVQQQGGQARPAQPSASPQTGGAGQKKGEKPPPAPTVGPGQNAFFPTSKPSPSGVPQYADNVKTPDIKMPPNKKQKKAATPASTSQPSTSPPTKQMAKPTTEIKQPEPPKMIFKCDKPGCEFASRGFGTQEELQAHMSEVHTEDGHKFSLDSMGSTLGVDAKSIGKKSPPDAKVNGLSKAQAVANLKNSKQAKASGPTSAPKEGDVSIKPENAWAESGFTMEDFKGTFGNPEPFASNDAVLRTLLETSPAALTPSSSRTSSTDVAEHSNLNLRISYGATETAPNPTADSETGPHIVDADAWFSDMLNLDGLTNTNGELDLLGEASLDIMDDSSKTVTDSTVTDTNGNETIAGEDSAALDAILNSTLNDGVGDSSASLDFNMDKLFESSGEIFMEGLMNDSGEISGDMNDWGSLFGEASDENKLPSWD